MLYSGKNVNGIARQSWNFLQTRSLNFFETLHSLPKWGQKNYLLQILATTFPLWMKARPCSVQVQLWESQQEVLTQFLPSGQACTFCSVLHNQNFLRPGEGAYILPPTSCLRSRGGCCIRWHPDLNLLPVIIAVIRALEFSLMEPNPGGMFTGAIAQACRRKHGLSTCTTFETTGGRKLHVLSTFAFGVTNYILPCRMAMYIKTVHFCVWPQKETWCFVTAIPTWSCNQKLWADSETTCQTNQWHLSGQNKDFCFRVNSQHNIANQFAGQFLRKSALYFTSTACE